MYQTPLLRPLHSARATTRTAKRPADWRVRRVLAKINERRGSPELRLAMLSNELGLTPSHLGKQFKSQVGVGFRVSTMVERMAHAVILLEQSDLGIKQIAAEIGYKHTSDLDHKFKSIYGLSPRQYRQRSRVDERSNTLESLPSFRERDLVLACSKTCAG